MVSEGVRLTPSEYIVWIGRAELLFLRVRNRGGCKILFRCSNVRPTDRTLETCLSSLIASPAYFGQPIDIILNTEGYSYIKHIGKIDASQLFERLKLVRDADFAVAYRAKKHKRKTYLVYEASDSQYLSQLYEITGRLGIPICQVARASTLLFEAALERITGNYVAEFRLTEHERLVLAFDQSGNALAVSVSPTAEYPDQNTVATLFEHTNYVHELFTEVPRNTGTNHVPSLSHILLTGLRRLPRAKTTGKNGRKLGVARLLKLALNSAKLLVILLLAMNVFLGAVLLSFTVFIEKPSDAIRTYQFAYSRKYMLQQSIDSLNAYFTTAGAHSTRTSAAAIVSLFCQRSVSGLYVDQLVLKMGTADSLQVEVSGKARNERSVFAYRTMLDSLFAPLAFTMNSVRPVLVTDMGRPDTLTNFKLATQLHD